MKGQSGNDTGAELGEIVCFPSDHRGLTSVLLPGGAKPDHASERRLEQPDPALDVRAPREHPCKMFALARA